MTRSLSPIARGIILAVLAALSFGATAPVIALAGRSVGPLTTAALLYFGAALSAIVLRVTRRSRGAVALPREHWPRIAVVSFVGAAVAPVCLAWGLQRVGGTVGSLLLNLEAIFTVLLARAIYREPIGCRVVVAMLLMLVAGVGLVLDVRQVSAWSLVGLGAVGLATLAWSLDNTLTRPLAEDEPTSIVAAKGSLGAAMTALAAIVLGEARPDAMRAATLLACGATGYGLSLRLYLLAQRRIGVARTGSVFAVAPFIGAAIGWALGFRAGGPLTVASAALFALAVYLHLTEHHGHRHRHDAVAHEHPHRHDDGHHTHQHVPAFAGEHTHSHQHDPVEHEHEHAPDVHHAHDHDGAER